VPSIFSHPAVPLAIGLALGSPIISPRLLLAGVIASILPDFDVITFEFDVGYSSAFGHRGITHSLSFALALALAAALFASNLRSTRQSAFWFVLVAAASHGLLDMLTNGGRGVAWLWPFSDDQLFFPVRVIEVSPIGFRFLSGRGLQVLQSEFLWVWLPCITVCLVLYFVRRKHSHWLRA
jgi:inner membrane protein